MAKAHGKARALFGKEFKDHLRTAADFWVALVHVVYGKLQAPNSKNGFQKYFL